jgi:hypothetical protein
VINCTNAKDGVPEIAHSTLETPSAQSSAEFALLTVSRFIDKSRLYNNTTTARYTISRSAIVYGQKRLLHWDCDIHPLKGAGTGWKQAGKRLAEAFGFKFGATTCLEPGRKKHPKEATKSSVASSFR